MQTDSPQKLEKTIWQEIKETIYYIAIALIIVIPIRAFVAQPFIVSGDSMVPTFINKDYLIVDELSYHFRNPRRGEVVVFRYPGDPDRFFIKRVVGLPNETITIRKNTVTIINQEYPYGFVLDETYLQVPTERDQTVTLAEDEYFVMGDNRTFSSDSRVWGPLGEDYIVGRAFIRLFPLKKFGFHPGYSDLNQIESN